MIILTIRTDKPEAEIGIYDNTQKLTHGTWLAHRELAETLHTKIAEMLQKQKLEWPSVEGVVCYKGPGSFTGLRIGLSVANTLAYGLAIPIVGASGTEWIEEGVRSLINGQNDGMVTPWYGAGPHITQQSK